ncbi:MAG: serine protease [Planctomycetota bacterium]
MKVRTGILSLLLVALAVAPTFAQSELSGLLDRVAPSIVTVKVVIKTEFNMMGQTQNEEQRSELQGVVVDPSGLIMISNAEISADRMKEAMGAGPFGEVDLKMTPSDFKIVFGNEETEHAAFLVATDTKLDLAFLQVQELGERKPSPVVFAEDAEGSVGDLIVSVSRLQKGYDYAPYFATGRISGVLQKPRTAWIVDGNIGSYGLPIFTSSGKVVGVLVTLAASTTEESGGGFGSLLRMMRGAGGSDGPLGTFVLPSKLVARLIEQAKAKAVELKAEMSEKATDEGK